MGNPFIIFILILWIGSFMSFTGLTGVAMHTNKAYERAILISFGVFMLSGGILIVSLIIHACKILIS